jgi:uncharacterized protein (DUF1697 family)
MIRYIALLRGVNIGGRNKVSMPDIKAALEKQGFQNVFTYINSGNIVFDSNEDATTVKITCETAIKDTFNLDIPVRIITTTELQETLSSVPDWWDNAPDTSHNAIFIIPPMTAKEVRRQLGKAKPEYEKVACHGDVIFWSASLANYSRASFAKIAANKTVNNYVTVRNANTTKRLLELSSI